MEGEKGGRMTKKNLKIELKESMVYIRIKKEKNKTWDGWWCEVLKTYFPTFYNLILFGEILLPQKVSFST